MTTHKTTRERMGAGRSRTAVLAMGGTVAINVALLAVAVAGLICYLAFNNQAAAKGFQIRALEKRISDLQEAQQQLALAAVAGQSMDTINGQVQGLGFVPVTTMDFVNAPGGAVAMR